MLIKKAQSKGGRYSIELTEEGNLFDINEYEHDYWRGGSCSIPIRQEAVDRFYDLIEGYKADGINLYLIK
ncbi:MAG: hypothetical protein ACXVKK_04080 [Flavisolibacter sp.]